MNHTFSFFNIFLMYVAHRNPECPHILYNEDIEAIGCQKNIVELHNIQRTVVASWIASETMLNMTWDVELAKKAQDVVRKCKFKYEQVEDARFQTGQNMYLKCSNSDEIRPNWTEPIRYWFKRDKVRPNYALSNGDTGQVTWRKLRSPFVGCGYGNYKIEEKGFLVEQGVGMHISGSEKDFCQMYVCVYGLE